jgi:hypothetical protein
MFVLKGGGYCVAGKKDSVREIIRGLYEIAAELLISVDKNAQEQGRQLRRLIEQLEKSINAPKANDH